ncbi:DNA/RNA helicase domain-containing protein [Corynebacterium sp. ACRQL]|uniref:DNA/RNA helicase domain-containing protein n=1 Tax=unclassified Corynebacterium TaxID=2624378 RepID=UPI00351D7426
MQGFDLNYVGVIIGPSVKLRDGQIEISPDESFFRAATNMRTMSDGSGKEVLSDTLLWNQLYVLMTRGVHGLFVYACDKELRDALLEAQKTMRS